LQVAVDTGAAAGTDVPRKDRNVLNRAGNWLRQAERDLEQALRSHMVDTAGRAAAVPGAAHRA